MEQSEHKPATTASMSLLTALVISVRPKQWTKNLILFFALFFAVNEAWQVSDLGELAPLAVKTIAAFALFSGLSSAVYLVNDIFDVTSDRSHPVKRHRPLASEALSVPLAWAAAALLASASVAAGFLLEPAFGAVSAIYLALMVAYTIGLKRIVILDVFSISAGFVLRAVAGAAVLQVPISPWLYICTGLGALFIALSKRKAELALAGDGAAEQRGSLDQYTLPLLDIFIAIVAPSTLLSYTLYTFTADNLPDNHAMMLTIPFVVYGLFRYIYLVQVHKKGENPEDVLITDVPLISCIGLWLAAVASILVAFR